MEYTYGLSAAHNVATLFEHETDYVSCVLSHVQRLNRVMQSSLLLHIIHHDWIECGRNKWWCEQIGGPDSVFTVRQLCLHVFLPLKLLEYKVS